MSSSYLNNIPSWLSNPSYLHNILHNQFTSLKNVSSATSLTDSSLFAAGLRQALYWKKRLSHSTSPFTVIFSLLGPKGLLLPNVTNVCQALSNVCNFLNITEIYHATNSHFIGFTFSTASDASQFRSSFTYYSDSLVIHVPTSSPLTHHFKLLWLPPVFPDQRIHHFLNKYTAKHCFTRDIISTGPNNHVPTNSVTGTFELSPTADIGLLPHLIPLPSPHLGHAFLIISDRPSLCLRCEQLGHVRHSCTTPRCTSCHRYHHLTSSCPETDPAHDFLSSEITFFDDSVSANPAYLDHSSSVIPDTTHTSSKCDHTPLVFANNNNLEISSLTQPESHNTLNHSSEVIPHITTLSSLLDKQQNSTFTTSTAIDNALLTASPDHSSNLDKSFHVTSYDELPSPLVSTSFSSLPAKATDKDLIPKRITRSMTTSKRPLNSSLFSSPGSTTKRSNIFSSLNDEVDDEHMDLTTADPSQPHTADLSGPPLLQDTSSNSSPFTLESLNLPLIASQSASSYNLLPNKCTRSLCTDSTSTSSPPLVSDPVASSHTWADQVEHDFPLQSHPTTILNSTTIDAPPLTSTTIGLDHVSNSSNLPPPSNSSSSSDHDESDSESQDDATLSLISKDSDLSSSSRSQHSSSSLPSHFKCGLDPAQYVFISGFPPNTVRGVVVDFLNPLAPIALWHITDSPSNFIGHFGATFASTKDASLAIKMNGQSHCDCIITIRQLSIKT